jgi:hypothetical protein
MQFVGAQVWELIDDRLYIHLGYVPTSLKQSTRIDIRTRGFVTSSIIHRGFELFLRERLIEAWTVAIWGKYLGPIEFFGTLEGPSLFLKWFCMMLFLFIICEPPIIVLEAEGVIFSVFKNWHGGWNI